MKVFYRMKKLSGIYTTPYNYNIANALDGAMKLGLECIPYYTVNEIYEEYKVGDIVLDGVQQVQYCLDKFGVNIPNFDYPDILQQYLGRKVWKDTINSISNSQEKWSAGNFVKPIKQKVFTGRIVSSIGDLVGCGSCFEDYEVLVSEPLEVLYECRGFVYYDRIKDLRPYNGDFRYMKYMDTELIYQAVGDWKNWDDRPNACSLDWGVVKSKNNDYKTVLIEGNLPYALGCYGYDSIDYIKLISAYISQISGVQDELYF